MRIREAGDSRGESLEGPRRRRSPRAVKPAAKPEFARTLGVARVEAIHCTLDELLAELDRTAEELRDKRSLAVLRKYRELVQSFLDTVLHQAYAVQQQTGFDRKGRRRVYVLVQRVNQALEELAQLTLSRHADPLLLLEKLGEIRGLLVDLYT
ncbi:MAG: YaaR family protein [Bacillota bacterium]|nr:YaaR family protein [Bacillota bacterium]